MPRQARVDLPGLLHHVMARGMERRAIFQKTNDYQDFLDRIALLHQQFPCQILAWALMPNHFHLLIRSGPAGLRPFMQRIMTGYATAFNARHKRAGHLFQNRYKSVICEEDPYLLELVRYIHLNPLRARLVKDVEALADFPYCGHGALLGRIHRPWQETGEVLQHFSSVPHQAADRYESFVREGVGHGKRRDLMGGGLIRSQGGIRQAIQAGRRGAKEAFDSRILGSGEFVVKLLKTVEKKKERSVQLVNRGVTLAKAAQRIALHFSIPPSSLFEKDRSATVSEAKALLIHIGVEYLGKRNRELALLTRISDGAATRARRRGRLSLAKSSLADWLEVN